MKEVVAPYEAMEAMLLSFSDVDHGHCSLSDAGDDHGQGFDLGRGVCVTRTLGGSQLRRETVPQPQGTYHLG